MKLFERAIRRAEIPIKMSKGFNPRPKIAFPLALSVGIKGIDEKLELELCERIQVSEIESRLKKQLPESIQITSVDPITTKQKSSVTDVAYVVRPKEGKMPGAKEINEFLSRDVVNTQRKRKNLTFDLRSSVINITTDSQSIGLNLKMTPRGIARPEEVLSHLGLKAGKDYEPSKIVRTRVNLSSSH
jgi:radical SAM-linked protein